MVIIEFGKRLDELNNYGVSKIYNDVRMVYYNRNIYSVIFNKPFR